MTIRHLMLTVVLSAVVLAVAHWIHDLDRVTRSGILAGLILLAIPVSIAVGVCVWAVVTPDARWRQTGALRRDRAASFWTKAPPRRSSSG